MKEHEKKAYLIAQGCNAVDKYGVPEPETLAAMQSYSDQQNAGLLAWKESAMRELNELDLQSLGRKLGIGLGQSVSENIHAKVDGLLERVKELEATDPAQVVLAEGYHRLQSENERLRQALERILQGNCSPTLVAKEALKQQ